MGNEFSGGLVRDRPLFCVVDGSRSDKGYRLLGNPLCDLFGCVCVDECAWEMTFQAVCREAGLFVMSWIGSGIVQLLQM